MLVLSRRQDDKVLFPNLGVSVQILRVANGKVRLGIDAPPDIRVLRHELEDHDAAPAPQKAGVRPLAEARLKRHLASAASALNKLHRLYDREDTPGSEDLIFELFHHLKSIDDQAQPAPARTPETGRTALLVEDNRNESELLASYLRLRDFDVAVADDGEAALDYLSSNREPDVVLLDMQMPGMDGPTAIKKMRSQKRFRDLRVFAVSGGDPSDYGVEVSPSGVNGWFPKPLNPDSLMFRLALDEKPARDDAPVAAAHG